MIRILPSEVINQIAAGEVIQRPSSVVRELLENSIDANAKKIDLFIKDSGKNLIQLVDDGEGMNLKDARMSIIKYATSKIKNINDLLKINTKGFRGEALSAISLVSQLEIQTKSKKSSIGIHLFIENGKIKKEILLNMNYGTRVSVKNLFYQYPARKESLKSSQVEFQNIVNEFYKIVLAHRNILYRFYHNGKILFFFEKNSLKKRIVEIFKVKNHHFKSIFIKKKNFFIKGFIGFPHYFYNIKKKGDQIILVNHRYVKYLTLHKKIIFPYKKLLKNIKSLSYFIFIYVNPSLVNWNIHPSKKEIQIEKEETIGLIIQNKIKEVFFQQYQVEKIELDQNYFYIEKKDEKKDLYDKKIFQLENCIKNVLKKSDNFNSYIPKNFLGKLEEKINNSQLLQINKKYIIFTFNNEDLIFLDQHKAHKKILYDFFIRKNELENQDFIFPIKINLLKRELITLNNIQVFLKKLGFYFFFSKKSVYLYSIPEKIRKNMLDKILKKILCYNNFFFKKKEKKNWIIHSISSFSSIQYGEKLYPYQMKKLIKELFSCKNPEYTNSGELIFFVFNKNFLENFFEK